MSHTLLVYKPSRLPCITLSNELVFPWTALSNPNPFSSALPWPKGPCPSPLLSTLLVTTSLAHPSPEFMCGALSKARDKGDQADLERIGHTT